VISLILQRSMVSESGGSWVHWAIIFIAVIIGGGLLVWAVNVAIANFVPDEWKVKVQAFFYIIIAIALAALVFHWAGMI
jgi:hypothetical protein